MRRTLLSGHKRDRGGSRSQSERPYLTKDTSGWGSKRGVLFCVALSSHRGHVRLSLEEVTMKLFCWGLDRRHIIERRVMEINHLELQLAVCHVSSSSRPCLHLLFEKKCGTFNKEHALVYPWAGSVMCKVTAYCISSHNALSVTMKPKVLLKAIIFQGSYNEH